MSDSMFEKIPDSTDVPVMLYINGEPVAAITGESVAGVLLRQSTGAFRTTAVSESTRAPYCMMGVCFDCLAVIDGVASTQACLVTVKEAMRIETQHGRRSLIS